MRPAGIHALDRLAHFVGSEDAFLDQQLAHRDLEHLVMRQRVVVIGPRRVRVGTVMRVGDLVHHASSQCS